MKTENVLLIALLALLFWPKKKTDNVPGTGEPPVLPPATDPGTGTNFVPANKPPIDQPGKDPMYPVPMIK